MFVSRHLPVLYSYPAVSPPSTGQLLSAGHAEETFSAIYMHVRSFLNTEGFSSSSLFRVHFRTSALTTTGGLGMKHRHPSPPGLEFPAEAVKEAPRLRPLHNLGDRHRRPRASRQHTPG
ncbi:unnamed protein product, partial [Ectocarpus sp. 6 AP-2014]